MSLKLWSWKASEIVDSLASGEISQLDVLNSLEERYFEVNPVINALPTVCFEQARAYLASEDRAFRKKRPLMGLPVPIKDSYAVSGVRTTFGSLSFKNWIPDRSDRVVTTLEKSGAVIFAKSNTPEFEAGASTFNEVFGITRNPWNLKRSVAGSSGGAAAAVASGMAFIAQGSDFACSIRYPAAFCGIIGLRPTPGLIPQGPNRLPYQNLSVIGPLARNVEDIGLAMDAMVAFDALDPLTSPTFAQEYRLAAKSARKPKNIGFSMDMGGVATISEEVEGLVSKSLTLIEGAGVKINYLNPNFREADEIFRPLRAAQFAGMWSDVLKGNRHLLKPEVIWNIEQGLDLKSLEISNAEIKRQKIRTDFLHYLEKNDFLLFPTAPVVANLAEDRFVKEINGIVMKDYLQWLLLGYVISLTGCPTISIPCGLSDQGLPVGIQVVARPYEETKLLNMASWLESTLNHGVTTPIDPISF